MGKGMICMLLLLFWGCLSVQAISELSVNYHFFSKKVAVRIENFTEKNGRMIPWEENEKTVLPGGFVSRIPIIYNEGMDCYVRAQVKIVCEKASNISITLEDIEGICTDWIRIGDYFYYQDIVLEDEKVKFFDGIYVPKDLEAAIDDENQWEIQVKVDAIQAEYIAPDFQSEDPWGERMDNIEILEAKEEDGLEDKEKKSDSIFTIESETEAFQIEIEETFQNMAGFVAGETKEHKIKIRNLDSKERILYLNADVSQDNLFLEELKATIWWECEGLTKDIYHGCVSKIQETLKNLSLTVSEDSESMLHVVLTLSKEANNTFSAQEGSFCLKLWDKTVLKKVDPVSENLEDVSNEDDIFLGNSFVIQTGDNSRIWNGIVGLCIAVCLFFLSIWKGKRGHEA